MIRKIIFAFLVFGLMVVGFGCTVDVPENTTPSEEELCSQGGGTWKQMPDACVDSCESQRDDMVCAQVITEGCDCGEGMCWNGQQCEPIDEDSMNAPQQESVDIEDFAYVPGIVEVSEGGTVTWTNLDSVDHTVTAFDDAFDSGTIEPGSSWSYTFAVEGDYDYYCTLHPYMEGTVSVN